MLLYVILSFPACHRRSCYHKSARLDGPTRKSTPTRAENPLRRGKRRWHAGCLGPRMITSEELLSHPALVPWVRSVAAHTKPARIQLCDGSNDERRDLERELLAVMAS